MINRHFFHSIPGKFRVVQLHGKREHIRDFDAEEWSYEWIKRGGVDVLIMRNDRLPDESDSFNFVEFSAPVSVGFERDD